MPQYAKEGVERALQMSDIGVPLSRFPVQGCQFPLHPLQRMAADIDAPGFDECAEKLHAVTGRNDPRLPLVKLQAQFARQEIPGKGLHTHEPFPVRAHHETVVHVPAIVLAVEAAFHVVVKDAQIDIAEELRGEVADGQPAVFSAVEQAFVAGQRVPVAGAAFHQAVLGGVEQDDFSREILHKFDIHHLAPSPSVLAADAVAPHAVQPVEGDVQQFPPVDMGEIPPDVKFEYMAGLRPVKAFLPEVPLQPSDAEMSAAPADAAVGVGDEGALQHLVRVVVIQVMDDPVPELRGKHLPPLRVADDEAGGWQRTITARHQIMGKALQIPPEVALESEDIGLVPLVPACAEKSLPEVGEQLNRCKTMVFHIVKDKCLADGPHRKPVEAVVVVPVVFVRIEVEVAGVGGVGGVERTRPIVAPAAGIVELRTIAVAGGRQEPRTGFRQSLGTHVRENPPGEAPIHLRFCPSIGRRTACGFAFLLFFPFVMLCRSSYQSGYLFLDGGKEEHALYRRLALDGIGKDVVHDLRDGAHALGRAAEGKALAAVLVLRLRIGHGQLLLPCLELPFRPFPVTAWRKAFGQGDVHFLLTRRTHPPSVGRILGQARHREADEAESVVAAFQRLAGNLHLRIDMLHAEPCAPFVGTVEIAFLIEVDGLVGPLGLTLLLFFQYIAYLCHDGFFFV